APERQRPLRRAAGREFLGAAPRRLSAEASALPIAEEGAQRRSDRFLVPGRDDASVQPVPDELAAGAFAARDDRLAARHGLENAAAAAIIAFAQPHRDVEGSVGLDQ